MIEAIRAATEHRPLKMSGKEAEDEIKAFVTGFGGFLDVKVNPFWEIVARLPSSLRHKGLNIRIITAPEPLKAVCHSLLEIPKLLEEFKPDIVIYIALAVNRNFLSIERGATRDGYHQYPDVARKVFNKAEIRKTWGKSPKDLNSSLDLDDILVKWQTQAGKGSDLKMSDDVGTYVFSFVYYTSIECVWKNGGGEMPVVFMHVPSLPEKDGVEKGTKVTIALVKGYGREHRQVKYCIYAATHISSRFSSVLQRIPK